MRSPFAGLAQMYIAGHAQNERDGLLMSVSDPKARGTLLANFLPIKAPSGATEYSVDFWSSTYF